MVHQIVVYTYDDHNCLLIMLYLAITLFIECLMKFIFVILIILYDCITYIVKWFLLSHML